MGAVFAVSSLARAPLPAGMSDKAGHILGYTLLGMAIARALAGGLGRRLGARAALLAVVATVVYGITDELHQAVVPGRSADVHDVYADAAGALIAVVVCWAWGILATRRPAARRSP